MFETRFSESHEWARSEEDDTAIIGITDYAQEQLGDIVFVELPNIGDSFEAGDEVAVIESVKAADSLHTPVSGTVIEVNEDLNDSPELVNESPTDGGWFLKLELSDPSETETMMSEQDYLTYTNSLE